MATRINIYHNRGQWCYAVFVDGEYDHSDTLDAKTETEARDEVAEMFVEASINRVGDTNE